METRSERMSSSSVEITLLFLCFPALGPVSVNGVPVDGSRTPADQDEETYWSFISNNVTLGVLAASIAALSVLSTLVISLGCWRKKASEDVQDTSGQVNILSFQSFSTVNSESTNQGFTDEQWRHLTFGVGTLRNVAMSMLQDLLLNLYNIKVKLESKSKAFRSTKELPMVIAVDYDTVQAMMKVRLNQIFPEDDDDKAAAFEKSVQRILSSNCPKELLEAMGEICRHGRVVARCWKVDDVITGVIPKEGQGYMKHTFDCHDKNVVLKWDRQKLSSDFIEAVSEMAQNLRDERRQPTPTEYVAFHCAYRLLNNGKLAPQKLVRCLGTPGFRPYTQTYMSLTDPGDGHTLGTTRFNEWMQGAIVHVEHLERPRHLPREHIESYRVPSLMAFSKVRLHVGLSAPTTYFVGRRMKDSGNFDEDFLKLVHITSASATAAFRQGAAECKVAMEGLTTSQAVQYMHALREHVQRNKFSQLLSAAWNLNQTVTDDYEGDPPAQLAERVAIARRAIEITSIGGFDKITWDGASDSYPSKCIMYQLTFEAALTIVHLAHERGLLTYFSAGFRLDEIQHAVFAGVDGIGIGGAQVLRFMDGETGMHGPYMEENIPVIMQRRDEAAGSVRGRGVHLLARMDSMYFEGSITADDDVLRRRLFQSLLEKNEAEIGNLIRKLQPIVELRDEGNLPLAGVAARLCSTDRPVLRDYSPNSAEWRSFTCRLTHLVKTGDQHALAEEYGGEPWFTYRRKYRQRLCAVSKGHSRQGSFTLPCKAFLH